MYLTNPGRGVLEGGFDGTFSTCLHYRHLLSALGNKRSGQCRRDLIIFC